MASFSVDVHDGLPPDESALVDRGLAEANDKAAPLHEVRPLSCFARGASGQVIGGAVGRWWGPCCELQQLWVQPSHRGQGIARQLVRAFEERAREHGCSSFYLETFDFQAPALYRSLGYAVAYAHEVYPHGIVKYVMVKMSAGRTPASLPATTPSGRPLVGRFEDNREVNAGAPAAPQPRGESIMPTGTVRLQRVLRCPPSRVYRAFLDADAMAKWLPPYGFVCKVHRMEAKVGGTFRMSFHNFSTGSSHSFGGEYLELVPDELIRYTDRFDDPNLPGELRVTISLKAVSCGTELSAVQEGIPEAIPVEMCYLGWQESLVQLAHLVEPDIPG